MLDDRVRTVLSRLEEEDRREREAGLPAAQRSRQVTPATGRFLFTTVAPQAAVEVLEIGVARLLDDLARIRRPHSRRHRRLARVGSAEVRGLAGEHRGGGLVEWAQLVEDDAFETLKAMKTSTTSSSSTPRSRTTRRCSRWLASRSSPARS